jgi:hypothetical protein
MIGNKTKLACGYGGHDWVRGEETGHSQRFYTRVCQACGAIHSVTKGEWDLLPGVKETHEFSLTTDEQQQIVDALYERRLETQRYIETSTRIIEQHAGHEQCCGADLVARETVSLEYITRRLDLINSALVKLGEDAFHLEDNPL